MPSRPNVSRTPLLSSAQAPGRLSDSSLASASSTAIDAQRSASYSSSIGNMGVAGGGAGRNGIGSGARFGPTAQLSNGQARALAATSSSNTKAAFLPVNGMDDDDDMDDHLHTFTAAEKKDLTSPFDIMSWRGWANAITLLTLLAAIVGIFALYPIISFYADNGAGSGRNTPGYNLGGVNASGQFPSIAGLPTLVDPDTPEDVYLKTGFDGEEWRLVFSDEFNVDGRTFYDGDDPFWTAMDLNYWPTNDFEWHDPSVPTTKDGHLVITMSQEDIHDLNLKSGMLQSWNKLCFNKNAIFEVSASLPGTSDVGGFWPGVWTMGNLGRAAYGGTTEGTWPYTYTSCDVGTLPNQTWPNGTWPVAATNTGAEGDVLSYLPGQRLSACTCPGEDHPGPDVSVGRAAPEIDLIEAQVRLSVQHGEVSQSFQVAPFDDFYQFDNTTGKVELHNDELSQFNTYLGGHFQQAVSGLTLLPDRIYYDQVTGGRSQEFSVFSFEYSANPKEREKGYIHWVTDGKPAWTMYADAVGPNPRTGIGRRIVSEEPMYMILNLHASNNFQMVDWAHMQFPNYLRIDYVRVYQRNDGSGTLGCDPPDMPTKDYIERHMDVYTNPNITVWQPNKPWPKNRLVDQC